MKVWLLKAKLYILESVNFKNKYLILSYFIHTFQDLYFVFSLFCIHWHFAVAVGGINKEII